MNSPNMAGEIMAEKSHCNFDMRPGAQAQNNKIGENRPASLSGFVYVEDNQNGVRDAGAKGSALGRLGGSLVVAGGKSTLSLPPWGCAVFKAPK